MTRACSQCGHDVTGALRRGFCQSCYERLRYAGQLPPRSSSRRLTDDEVLRQPAGATVAVLCDRYPVSKSAMRTALVAAGVTMRPPGPRPTAAPTPDQPTASDPLAYDGGWRRHRGILKPVAA